MSLSGALSAALTGIQVSGAVTQVISSNVSNAGTPGYTKESADLAAITTGSGFGGVEIGGYSRVTDSVLSTTLNNATSNAAYLSTQNSYMSQVQSLLDSTSNPPALSSSISNFEAAWTQYSASPDDGTLEKNVVSTGEVLANTISSIATQTATLQTNVEANLSTTVSSLNSALQNIQKLNVEITAAKANNQDSTTLQDQRDAAITQVAQYTNVTVMQRDNGQIALYTSSGVALIDGAAQTFSVGSDGNTVVNASGSNVTSALTGGSLQAQTDFLSTSASSGNGVGVISKLQSQILNFANMFVSTATGGFAATYNSATSNSGDLTTGFFTATTDSNGNITDATTLAVASTLISGASNAKAQAADAVATLFNSTSVAIGISTPASGSTSNVFSATGITATGQTYSGIATNILSGFQQAANSIKNQSASASTQVAYYQSSLSSETGVNTDTELINLTSWENSYAASAHVISTIQTMMQALENMVS